MKEMIRKRWKNNIKVWLMKEYYIFNDIPIINGYVYDVPKILKLIKPVSDKQIQQQTMKLINNCILSIAIFLMIIWYIGNFSFFSVLLIFLYSYISINQIVTRYIEKEDYKLMKQLEKYLGDVRHYYHAGGLVEEAIYDSLEDSPYEISLHMQKIYDLLIEEDVEEIQEYKETAPNKYLTTFVALCQITLQFGDTLKENSSLFLSNINHLKQEIHMELLKRDKVHFTFAGFITLAVVPILFLDPIKHWGITNLPELEKFYMGKYGILVSAFLISLTVLSYFFIHWLKGQVKVLNTRHRVLEWLEQKKPIDKRLTKWMYEHPKNIQRVDYLLRKYNVKITVRQYLLKCMLYFFASFIILNCLYIHTVYTARNNLIYYTKEYKGASPMIGKEDLEKNRIFISETINQLKELDTNEWELQLKNKMEKTSIKAEEKDLLEKEIEKRLKAYKKSGFHLYLFIFNSCLSIMASFLPKCFFIIRGIFLRFEMEDEVMQLYSIILMLRSISRMNVETILEWMENFSMIFQSSIMECVDHYSFDNEGALNQLKEKEPFLPFVRIIENLEACDRVGVEQAFDELSGQRSYFMEKRKQDNEIFISNKGTMAKIAAYTPMVLVVGLYLIVPFILESLSQLSGYMSQMNGML